MGEISSQLMIAMGTALVTALLSVATTYVALVTKIRRDLEAQYDKDLRERRLTAYGALWALSEPLARYSPRKPLSPRGVRALSGQLRAWYFRDGMVLSAAAREAYFALQEELTAGSSAAAPAPAEPLAESAVADLHEASRALHTALANDVGSRRPPMIGFDDSEDRWWRAWWASIFSKSGGSQDDDHPQARSAPGGARRRARRGGGPGKNRDHAAIAGRSDHP